MLAQILRAVTQRLGRNSRQASAIGHAGEEERQMSDKLAGLHRLLGHRTDAQEGMEYCSMGKDMLEGRFFRHGKAVFLDIAGPQFVNEVRNGNFPRADGGALTAANAEIAELGEGLHIAQKPCQDGTDAAGIDMTVNMTAHHAPDGADIET